MKIIKYPNNILRQKSMPVQKFDSSLFKLIKKMKKLLLKQPVGVGLSAIQVGVPSRLFMIRDMNNKLTTYINPEIINVDQNQMSVFNEGCLSLPNKEVNIERSDSIMIKFLTHKGKEKYWNIKGFYAHVFLHEIDHLNGKLIIDYNKKDN